MDTTAADAFLTRWAFQMVCKGCGSRFELEDPHPGVESMPGFSRLVLLRVPEVCPECKSLQVVRRSAPAPASSPEGSESA